MPLHRNEQHEIFTQINSQIENQFHFHKTISGYSHSRIESHIQRHFSMERLGLGGQRKKKISNRKEIIFSIELMMVSTAVRLSHTHVMPMSVFHLFHTFQVHILAHTRL